MPSDNTNDQLKSLVGKLNAAAVTLAEKAVDLIREDHQSAG